MAGTTSKAPTKVTKEAVIIVGVITLGAFISLLNQTVMSPALPKLMADFQVSAGTAQWVTSIYMLVNGIMVPISGYLMDKFSTRKLFLASMGSFALGTALCAVAPAFGVLLAGRVLQAAGAGVLLPLVAVVPLLVFPVNMRGTAMGMAGIVMAAGPAIGPVVGGAVIDSLGWRAMFWGITVGALIILVLGVALLRNVGELKDPRLDLVSVLLSTVAFGTLLYGFSSASDMGWGNPVVLGCIAVGVVFFVVFVRRQLTLDEPLLRLEVLRTRRFMIAALTVTLINAAVAGTNVILPLLLQNGLGVSALETGMVMLPAAVAGIILSPVTGMLFDRFGVRGVGVIGMGVMTVALFVLSRLGLGTSAVMVAVFCCAQAVGQAFANMPINTWGVNALRDDMIAHGNAIANTGRQVCGAIATALVVTVMSNGQATAMAQGADAAAATVTGVGMGYLVCALIGLVGFVVTVLFVHRGRTPMAEEAQARAAAERAASEQ